MNYTEKDIIQGCINNDRFFQEMLYRKYFPSMMRFCMRHASDQDIAMQLLNNGFLRVFKKIDTFSFRGSLEGWIRRIIFNCIADFYRKNANQVRYLELAERDEPIDADALSHLYFDDIITLVNELPPATKNVFMLYAIEGYNHREIAEQLSISEGTSKWHLSSARKQLKKLIERNKPTSNAG